MKTIKIQDGVYIRSEEESWLDGRTMDHATMLAVIRSIKVITAWHLILTFGYVAIFTYPALQVARNYPDAYYFLILVGAFALAGFICLIKGIFRVRAISDGEFVWKPDTVAKRRLGGRFSHSGVYGSGADGTFYNSAHLIFSYSKGRKIAGVRFLSDNPSLARQLIFLHDPVAFKI